MFIQFSQCWSRKNVWSTEKLTFHCVKVNSNFQTQFSKIGVDYSKKQTTNFPFSKM